jgi:hypothetical protein
MKPLLTLIFSFLILASTSVALAQQSPLDSFVKPDRNPDGTIVSGSGFVPCSGADCSPCDLVVMFNTILKWVMLMIFLIFAIIAVKAGINMVVKGTASELSAAKKSFVNAFIGLFIILAAWLMIDTLLRSLLDGGNLDAVHSGYGPWSKIQCAYQVTPGVTSGYFPGDPEFVPPPVSYGTNATPSATADGRVRYQTSAISAQWSHASPPLQNMLNCIARIVPAGVGQISSISDTRIVSGTKTWAQCRLGGQSAGCAHKVGSLHYGGRGSVGQCGDRSFAVDYGDETNVRAICSAANACGRNNCSVHNGDHVHLSVPITCN